MRWHRSSTIDELPDDPVGEAVAQAIAEVIVGATVELRYAPPGAASPVPAPAIGLAVADGPGPAGWQVTVLVRLNERITRLLRPGVPTRLSELLDALPVAGMRAARWFHDHGDGLARSAAAPGLRRALRDLVATEVLAGFLASRTATPARADLVAEAIEYLIELSGTRVEAHALTHGVVIADALHHPPRLAFHYPSDVRAAKRAPLLFDGQRSVLVVDVEGRARTELERHRMDRLVPGGGRQRVGDGAVESGALVAEVTEALGGIGFFLRADRSIWTFVDGQPLLVRRGEHWTAFPLELTASISNMIGGGPVAALVARAAFTISAQPGGAILAIVDDPAAVDAAVPAKDRYDLRDTIDPDAMRPETRLHHLIDADPLDEHTLARLATLDGATVVDRAGRLIAYGAIVATADSQHEGARTSAARTLSEWADVVLKVSADGDITIFRDGTELTTLLAHPDRTAHPPPGLP